jgi:hypothetical protein
MDALNRAMPSPRPLALWWGVALTLLGATLTFRGYHSFDGDQAYRLPLLLDRLDPSIYAADPFVRSFDAFNPHRVWLWVLEGLARLGGLPIALLLVFTATFFTVCFAVERIARSVWPAGGGWVGWVAVGLYLIAKAGNIGTNHLFEAAVLDRQVALALGWLATASIVEDPRRRWAPALALGAAAGVHPSLGLQLVLVLGGAWGGLVLCGERRETRFEAFAGMVVRLGLCAVPGLMLNVPPGASLLEGMPEEDFRILATEIQSPQHLIPHLWRRPQWLAWFCYLALAGVSLFGRRSAAIGNWPIPRRRAVLIMIVAVVWLALAWILVDRLNILRVIVFQPFRIATFVRGLGLVLVAGRLVELWNRGGWHPRLRSGLIVGALTGDWMLVVAAACELAATFGEVIQDWAGTRWGGLSWPIDAWLHLSGLGYGIFFLSRHDPESGHWPLLGIVGLAALVGWMRRRWARSKIGGIFSSRIEERFRTSDRVLPGMIGGGGMVAAWGAVGAAVWIIPLTAAAAGVVIEAGVIESSRPARWLVARCRFVPVPLDDLERLAVWCRDHTPADARFVGPPGPKTFRLWSRRSLVFNRAASPYHAAGLADWFRRFQDHVDLQVSPKDFARLYQENRHGLESRYDAMTETGLARLAIRQGADHVIAAAPIRTGDLGNGSGEGLLEFLHREGKLAVYRVRLERTAQLQR